MSKFTSIGAGFSMLALGITAAAPAAEAYEDCNYLRSMGVSGHALNDCFARNAGEDAQRRAYGNQGGGYYAPGYGVGGLVPGFGGNPGAAVGAAVGGAALGAAIGVIANEANKQRPAAPGTNLPYCTPQIRRHCINP